MGTTKIRQGELAVSDSLSCLLSCISSSQDRTGESLIRGWLKWRTTEFEERERRSTHFSCVSCEAARDWLPILRAINSSHWTGNFPINPPKLPINPPSKTKVLGAQLPVYPLQKEMGNNPAIHQESTTIAHKSPIFMQYRPFTREFQMHLAEVQTDLNYPENRSFSPSKHPFTRQNTTK